MPRVSKTVKPFQKGKRCIMYCEALDGFFRWFIASVILLAIGGSSIAALGTSKAAAQDRISSDILDAQQRNASVMKPSASGNKGAFGEPPKSRDKSKTKLERRRNQAQDRTRARRLAAQRMKLRKRKAALLKKPDQAAQFAARLKRKLGRQFAKKRQDFRKQQLRVENQRRASRQKKARAKAREFAAARRHAALQAPKPHWKPVAKTKTRMRRR